MQSINASNYAYNSFDFSMQTSSGDKINLKLFDEKSSDISYKKNSNSTTMMLSLRHSYGYEFHYEGNGIDENDKKEIAKALEKIEPMLEKYLKNISKSEENLPLSKIVNSAFDMKQILPQPTDLDTKNYLNDKLLDSFDKVLQNAKKQNDNLLEETKKLFESLIKQMDRFELYM